MNKVHKKVNTRQTINLPDMVDIDTLSYASDDELIRRISYLNADREKAARIGYALEAWETEICYVQRELSIRQDRRNAHEKYIQSLPSDSRGYFDHDSSNLN